MSTNEIERLIRTRRRVADHGEVFTPSWLVADMLDLVGDEAARIDSRVLEPACGSGNFLVAVLTRKLATVLARYGRSDFEKRHHALHALMCLYGIELLPDNAQECRENLADIVRSFLRVDGDSVWARAAGAVLAVNIVQGDAVNMTDPEGDAIIFPEWGYLGRGRYQRRDFRYRDLTDRASFLGAQLPLLGEQELFVPVKTWPPMTVEELGR